MTSLYAQFVDRFFNRQPGKPQLFLDCPRCHAQGERHLLNRGESDEMVRCVRHGEFAWTECDISSILHISRVICADGTVIEKEPQSPTFALL